MILDSNQWLLPCHRSTLTNWANHPRKVDCRENRKNANFYTKTSKFNLVICAIKSVTSELHFFDLFFFSRWYYIFPRVSKSFCNSCFGKCIWHIISMSITPGKVFKSSYKPFWKCYWSWYHIENIMYKILLYTMIFIKKATKKEHGGVKILSYTRNFTWIRIHFKSRNLKLYLKTICNAL